MNIPPAPISVYDHLDEIVLQVGKMQRTTTWLVRSVGVLVLVVVVLGSGWWLTAQDHSNQRAAAAKADCRAKAQARRLDDFSVIVSPLATDAQHDAAANRIANGKSLVVSYAECG